MANLTKSWKSQKVNLFGPSPPTTWGTGGRGGTMTWGASTWGMKAAGPTGTPGLNVGISKFWTGAGNTVVSTMPASALFRSVNKFWSGSNKIGSTMQQTAKYITDSHGYYYVFRGTNPNIEQEPISFASTYTSPNAPVSGFSTYTAQSTSWVTSVSY